MSKIGDRYMALSGVVHEIVAIDKYRCAFRCVIDGNNWRSGEVSDSYVVDCWDGWTYLGNYAKSKTLTTLYDILND